MLFLSCYYLCIALSSLLTVVSARHMSLPVWFCVHPACFWLFVLIFGTARDSVERSMSMIFLPSPALLSQRSDLKEEKQTREPLGLQATILRNTSRLQDFRRKILYSVYYKKMGGAFFNR